MERMRPKERAEANDKIIVRHKLRHKLPAGAAGRNCLAVAINGYDAADRIFTVGNHIEHGVALGTYTERAGGINTDTYINLSRRRLDRSGNAACLDHTG